MIVEVPEKLEVALKEQAKAHGISPADYVREVLERELASSQEPPSAPATPSKSGFGILAKYGPAPSAEEIDANRADMFRGFGDAL